MKWHIVMRVGEADDFQPVIPSGEATLLLHLEAPGKPKSIRTNVFNQFQSIFGTSPTGVVADLVRLAACAFCSDLSIPRNRSVDGWTRDLHLYFPTENLSQWQQVCQTFSDALTFLSGDHWQLHPRDGQTPLLTESTNTEKHADSVSLFSGGLDSLIGVLDLLGEGKQPLLIGHYGAGLTHAFQNAVLKKLQADFPNRFQSMLVRVLPPLASDSSQHETTMRARSILFLALGLAAASFCGESVPLIVPENALISLNVPFTISRSGSLSTRTTHPHFIDLFRQVALGLGILNPIVLPYRFMTKGEMLTKCREQRVLRESIPLSMSCAHSETARWEKRKPGNHCGYCVPCLIRRASTTAADMPDAAYDLDVTTNSPPYKTKKGSDLRAIEIALDRLRSRGNRRLLFDVLSAGALPPDEIHEYTDAYRRGMDELANLLRPVKGQKS